MAPTSNIQDHIKPENLVYAKPALMNDVAMHYCPGCSHGVVHKLVAETIADMGLEESTIGIAPVGCAVFAYKFIDVDWQEAAHGRAPALASAIKRLNPDKMVFTYQGDGDLAAIGTAETIHACNRGENIVIIFINNGIYGMTGGQMAPTTLIGMKTATTPAQRIPPEDLLSTRTTRWYLLRHPPVGTYGWGCDEGKESPSQGLPERYGASRHLRRRDRLDL